MTKLKDVIQEWEKLLRRHRLALITSPMSGLYEEIEHLVPVKSSYHRDRKEQKLYRTLTLVDTERPDVSYELINVNNWELCFYNQTEKYTLLFTTGTAEYGLYYGEHFSEIALVKPFVEDVLKFSENVISVPLEE